MPGTAASGAWHQAVAGEELARLGLGDEPDDLELADVRVEPLDQSRPAPASQLRRVRDEDLVHAAGLEQLAVERRAALAQQRADALLGSQVGERLVQIDPALVADDVDRRGRLGRLIARTR